MRVRDLLLLGFVGLFTGCQSRANLEPPDILAFKPTPIALADANQLQALEQSIYQQINQYRQRQKLPPLKLHRQISQQARIHSQRMANQLIPFGHQDFQKRAETIAIALPYQTIAENVALNQGYQDPSTEAVKGWLNSPGHLKNIQGKFNLTGVGIAQDSQGKYYFTQIFLQQRSPQATSPIPFAAKEGIGFLEREAHRLVNNYRLSQGLPLLQLDERISYEARLYSQKMARKQARFSHDGFDERGKAVAKSLPWQKFGENLAYSKGYTNPVEVAVQGWIDSPGHQQNMVGDYDTTGMGIAQNEQGEYYFTQLFVKKH
jgi:uncharacterized protein YkwD